MGTGTGKCRPDGLSDEWLLEFADESDAPCTPPEAPDKADDDFAGRLQPYAYCSQIRLDQMTDSKKQLNCLLRKLNTCILPSSFLTWALILLYCELSLLF